MMIQTRLIIKLLIRLWGKLLPVCLILAACTPTQTLDPAEVQTRLQSAWTQGWHGQWELVWPEAPYVGSVIFEGWQTDNGGQRRYEILEAELPAFVGLTYLNDGQSARYFNRLDPTVALTSGEADMPFQPITTALDRITRQLAEIPETVRQQPIDLPGGPGLELTLSYTAEQSLTLWLDPQTNLILKADLKTSTDHITLIARSLAPLVEPHPQLFELVN
jgi:hypothetical protein